MFKKYIDRIVSCPNSMLVRILGVYKIKPLNQNFIMMESLIEHKSKSIIFDLKGSRVSRLIEGVSDPLNPPLGVVLKDENFRLYKRKLYMPKATKFELIKVLKADMLFLKDLEIIDYSLFVSISDIKSNNQRAIKGDEKYFTLGIIDIFEVYGLKKQTEQKLKKLLNKKKEISVAPPEEYYERLFEYLEDVFG
jgi:Phosphatidylinositol-4-phosphate 5-Kinase